MTRLIHFYVFRSIYLLERGVAGGIKWTAGVGVTPINKKPIMPPDAVPYPTKEILDALSDNEFLNPIDEMLWKARPLTVPVGTHIFFTEHANPEKGEVFTCSVGLEKPGYFKVDFEIQSGLGMNNQLPVGFSTQAVQGTTTYTVNIAMKYEIQRRKDHGFQQDQYAFWLDSLFDGLKRQMAFETEPKVELGSPNDTAIGDGAESKVRKEIPEVPPAPQSPFDVAKQHPNSDPDKLTLYDLFLLDFPSAEAQYQTGLTIRSSNTHLEWAVVWNIAEGSELIKLYIPHSTETASIIQGFIPNYKDALKQANEFEVKNRDQLSSRTLTFSNRIYAYNYDYLSIEEAAALDRAYKLVGLVLILRDMNYLQMRQLEAKVKFSGK